MKSVKYSGKQRINKPLFIRKIVGKSMEPFLKEGKIVLASSLLKPKKGRVVIFKQSGIFKVKYVASIDSMGLYLIGFNLENSTDSRSFGLVNIQSVVGVLIYPNVHIFSTLYPKKINSILANSNKQV